MHKRCFKCMLTVGVLITKVILDTRDLNAREKGKSCMLDKPEGALLETDFDYSYFQMLLQFTLCQKAWDRC